MVALFASGAGAQSASVQAQMEAAQKQREHVQAGMGEAIRAQKASLKRQSGAVEAQEENAVIGNQSDFFVSEPLISVPRVTGDCEQLSQLQVQALAERAGKANSVSPDLVRAVMRQESGFRPCAVSNKGAMGLMQLMPGTAADLGVADAFDPEVNTFAGAKLLRSLLTRYAGDLNRALGAYNAGPGNVDLANGLPPFPETRIYVDKIIRDLNPDAIAY